MKKRLIIAIFTLILISYVEGKKSFKSGRSSGAGRSSSRKTNYNPQPAPTSFSYPQPSAPKPSLFGWQEKPSKTAQIPKQAKPPSTQTHAYPPSQAKPSSGQGHSYPSSQTGMSGNNQAKQPPSYQESIQRSSASQNLNSHQAAPYPVNNQGSHSYPASPGLSGSSGNGYPQHTGSGYTHQQGSNYPQQGIGLSGTGAGAGGVPPPYPGNVNRPSNAGTYQNNNNYGNNYQHPPPPPPYSHVGPSYSGYGGYGSNFGGYGGHGSYNPGPQMPGYFGNYGNKNYGGVSRAGSALTGVGIAGAGVGTILTGLALWNLARSTGHHHHTVIYDNRGQPVAVAPANNTAPETDSILADLVNCTLSISNGNTTEVLAIPCSIATSFTPDANVKDLGNNDGTKDDTKCTVTVVNKEGREFMTTISCAILLNTAAENNVTEPPIVDNGNMNVTDNINGSVLVPPGPGVPLITNSPSALSLTGSDVDINNSKGNYNCTPEIGEIRDPINPCFALTHNITVAPLQPTEKSENKEM